MESKDVLELQHQALIHQSRGYFNQAKLCYQTALELLSQKKSNSISPEEQTRTEEMKKELVSIDQQINQCWNSAGAHVAGSIIAETIDTLFSLAIGKFCSSSSMPPLSSWSRFHGESIVNQQAKTQLVYKPKPAATLTFKQESTPLTWSSKPKTIQQVTFGKNQSIVWNSKPKTIQNVTFGSNQSTMRNL